MSIHNQACEMIAMQAQCFETARARAIYVRYNMI